MFGLVTVDNRRGELRFARDIGDTGANLFPVTSRNDGEIRTYTQQFRDVLRDKKSDFDIFWREEPNNNPPLRDKLSFTVEGIVNQRVIARFYPFLIDFPLCLLESGTQLCYPILLSGDLIETFGKFGNT